MIIKLTGKLGASALRRHFLFLAATTLTLLLIGYQFGTFDEAMHISFLKVMANPALYPGDQMLALRSIYYSFFWQFFIPFQQHGWLEPVLFGVHIISIYLSFWAIWELSETLFHNSLTSLISVVALIIPHFSFVGFPIFEFALLSRTFVLPFLIISLNQFLKGRVILAFFLAGLMYNIHVVSVNFILAMFALACLLEFFRIGVLKILSGVLVFILSALPILLWKAGGDPIDFSLRYSWVSFLNQTLFSQIFNMISPFPGTWLLVISGISALILFFVSYPKEAGQPVVTARTFFFAGILVMIVNVITVYRLPVTIIIQSQIARIGLWTLVLAYLFFSNLLARLYIDQTYSPVTFGLLAASFIFSPFSIVPLLTWLVVRYVKNDFLIKISTLLLPATILAGCSIFLFLGFWRPGIYIYGEKTSWVDVQEWARRNTSINARFITPPEKWGVQESDWRVHSERASIVTLSELLVAAFKPGYELDWKLRFEMLAPGALARFNGDYFWNVEVTRQAYANLSTGQLIRAACRFNAHYIVSEKPHGHNLPIAYENSTFYVYSVNQAGCRQTNIRN